MATVWLAHDVRHDRRVAIKVMHPELAAAIGAERFLAEIRVTANLQHPHILPLHDSGFLKGDAAGEWAGAPVLYYVMPYVPGESLRDRLQRERQLPLADALGITRDVAAALDYAHRQGVIHRDIKPENILLHEGRPLVADFGIALAVSAAGTARMTQTGLSLGTPHYMSPEQAVGERQIDHRTDIYALGAVLYEMLTGEPPFTGATVQAIIAKVMSERPVPPSTVRDTVPAYVEAAVLTALAKLPADRFASANEFSTALAAGFSQRTLSPSAPSVPFAPWRQWLAPGIAAASLLLAAGAWMSRGRLSSDRPAPVMRFEIPLPDTLRPQKVVLTPDGTRLLLSTVRGLFVYTLADARLARLEIPGVTAANDVDISPDGETLVFREGQSVKTMPFRGGPVRTLNDSVLTIRVGDDGYIYGRRWQEFRRISIRTGTSETLRMNDSVQASLDSLFGEVGEPIPVPGGRGVVFTINTYAPANTRIAVLDVRTGDVSFLPLPEMSTAQPIGFAPTGHLLFRSAGAIYAVPFDAKRLVATDAPEQVVGSVAPSSLSCVGAACSGSTTNGQSLAYLVSPLPTPALVNRRGEYRSLPAVPGNLLFHAAFPSRDGRMLVAQVQDLAASRQDIWTYRMPDGPMTRLATGDDGFLWSPRWTTDGNVRFASVRKEEEAIYSVPGDGSRAPQLLLERAGGFSWSIVHHPDGRRIATTSCVSSKASDPSIFVSGFECKAEDWALVVLYPEFPDSVTIIEGGRSQARVAEFSPDGRYIAFLAREVDRHDVYVKPLDGRDARWRVSRNGAAQPKWSRDGRTIYFLASDSLFAAEWRPEQTPPVGTVRALFPLGVLRGGWDVMPGDSTFVMIAPNQAQRTHIVVIANFAEQLRRSARTRNSTP